MSLADDLAQVTTTKYDRCTVGALLAKLDGPDRDALAGQLGAPAAEVPSAGIGRVLRSHGFQVADGALQRHRRGACNCVAV